MKTTGFKTNFSRSSGKSGHAYAGESRISPQGAARPCGDNYSKMLIKINMHRNCAIHLAFFTLPSMQFFSVYALELDGETEND